MLDQISAAKYYPPNSLDSRGRSSSYLPHAIWRVSPTHIIVVWASDYDTPDCEYRAHIIPWPTIPEHLEELKDIRTKHQGRIVQDTTLAAAVLRALASYYGE